MEHPGEESPDDIADVEEAVEEEDPIVEAEEVEEIPETARKPDPPEDGDAL